MSFRTRNEEKSYTYIKVYIVGSIRFLSSFEMTTFLFPLNTYDDNINKGSEILYDILQSPTDSVLSVVLNM
jgi:hypothetical protein